MLDTLREAEKMLPGLLADGDPWRSVFVDYHAPFVERMWKPATIFGQECRVCLHRIHPCSPSESLYHPHPWPSAMRVLEGVYEMSTGMGAGMDPPPMLSRFELPAGSAYDMDHPDLWHAVAPIGRPSFSLMVMGEPWAREAHKSTKALRPLSARAQAEMLSFFRRAYPRKS